jgi:UDP-3-O-[3-hydroxymyristoyl] N-acetylglucosamine deacetylase/3-hydroxyacyl-[acyl-carrier-protein] dehydratase
MIDRVVELVGTIHWRDQEHEHQRAVFQGHYPGNPVMPGVLQIEAMAQAAGILMIRKTTMEGKTRCS